MKVQTSAEFEAAAAGPSLAEEVNLSPFSKSTNEKNVNDNGNSPGGRARENLVVKFRVICDQHALFPGFFCQLTNLVFISTFKDNNGESH